MDPIVDCLAMAEVPTSQHPHPGCSSPPAFAAGPGHGGVRGGGRRAALLPLRSHLLPRGGRKQHAELPQRKQRVGATKDVEDRGVRPVLGGGGLLYHHGLHHDLRGELPQSSPL